jgi:two-component system sensor histidine kinase KdpD
VGLGTGRALGAVARWLPLVASRGKVGVLGVRPRDPHRFDGTEAHRLLDAFATQIATALERARLVDETAAARLAAEREGLRSTLLQSVSHDLQTPLAAMTGAAGTLLESGPALDSDTRRELLEAVVDEGERLSRLLRNLLSMTRLESGPVTVHKEWQPIDAVVGAALGHLDRRLDGREVRTHIPADLPLVPIDGALCEQALLNLLENAIKYGGNGPIDISATATPTATPTPTGDDGTANAELVLDVADTGPGIPTGAEQQVFDKFYRLPREGGGGGVGLGLAICRAITAAHGGRIWCENRPGGGASFKMALPVGGIPPLALPEEPAA